jgi:hypothetical protein
MARKLLLSRLVAQVQNGKLSREEAKRYFVIDPTAGSPFLPGLKLNSRTVDTAGLAQSATAIATALARDIDILDPLRAATANAFAHKATTAKGAVLAAAAGATILAEGDSWFDLPLIYPRTLVDFLGERHKIVTLAQWGDTLEAMVAARQFVEPLKTKAFRHFLFSGGGNDIVGGGRIQDFVRQYDVGHPAPGDAAWYVKDAFVDALDRVMALYREIAAIVKRTSPTTTLVVHGYACVLPQPNGTWLGKTMGEFLGLDPVHKAALCRAIVKVMLDAFNVRLKRFADSSNGAIVYVDLRKAVKADEWYDELHAREVAAKRFARAFETTLGL